MKASIVMAAVLAVAPAFAQTWQAEPSTVFGIPLGGSTAQVRTCPDEDWKNVEPACQVTNKHLTSLIHLYGVPKLGLPYTAQLVPRDGRVMAIRLRHKQEHFAQMRALLEERYGAPTKVQTETAVTQQGGRFGNTTLEWTGKKVSIVAIERIGTINDSLVSFSDNELLRSQTEESESRTKGAASKL